MNGNTIPNSRIVTKVGDPVGFTAFLFHFLPKNLLSFLLGCLTRIRLPGPLSSFLCRGFVRAFRIKIEESEQPLSEMHTIEDVFTRRIKPELRPIQGAFCSPADGSLVLSQPTHEGTAIQAKGLLYSLTEMVLGESADDRKLDVGWYTTIYLAPHNYHRVHACVAGTIDNIAYFPGELWPVNPPFVKRVPRLFTRNERLVFRITTPHGVCYVAMIGALNVGRMSSPYVADFCSNGLSRQLGASPIRLNSNGSHTISAGAELGTFHLGSTVVVTLDQSLTEHLRPREIESETTIYMGQALSTEGLSVET